ADLVDVDLRVVEATVDGRGRARGVGTLVGDPIGVAGGSVAGQLGEDRRSPRAGEPLALEHDDARAFADDEAVAVLVEGPAGARGRIVAAGERSQHAETEHTRGIDDRVGAAGRDDAGLAL